MQRGEPIAQSAVNVIRFSFSFTSIFSCICRMTMFVSGSSNLPLTFVSEIVRFVIYIHVIFIGNGIFAVSIFKSGQVFNNFYLGLVFIWVTFHVTLFNFETYQFHDSPCHFFATATTTDVSAAATEIVKDFDFSYFCDSHENEGKYGFTRIYIRRYMQPVGLIS